MSLMHPHEQNLKLVMVMFNDYSIPLHGAHDYYRMYNACEDASPKSMCTCRVNINTGPGSRFVVFNTVEPPITSLASQTLSGEERESGLIPIHYWCNLWGFKAGLSKWCYVNAATVHLHCLCAERAVVSIFGSCFGLAAT